MDEAYYYVSCRPKQPSAKMRALLDSVTLPCWLPHRRIADALGFSHAAIEAAEAACTGGSLYPLRPPPAHPSGTTAKEGDSLSSQ